MLKKPNGFVSDLKIILPEKYDYFFKNQFKNKVDELILNPTIILKNLVVVFFFFLFISEVTFGPKV